MGYYGTRPPGGAGASKQVIFNDAGALGGSPDFLFDRITKTLTVANCRILSAFLAQGALKTAQNAAPTDAELAPGQMAIWFDPTTRMYNVKARDAEGTIVNFQLVHADDSRLSDARPPLAHTHPGSEVTSKVGAAAAADLVPWAGVQNPPAAYPPIAHTHNGGDILVNTLQGNRLVDGAVDDQKLKSHATADPQRAVTRNHIRDGAVSAEKLADGAVTFQKLFIAQNAYTDLGATQQPVNGGAAFAPGVYACTLSIPNGGVCAFTMHVGRRGTLNDLAIYNVVSATYSVMGIPDAMTHQFSGMFDGRTYQLLVRNDGTMMIFVAGGTASGQTTFSFRKLA